MIRTTVVASLLVLAACDSPSITPTSNPTAAAFTSPTSTPTTTAAPSPAPTRRVNSALGFAVTLPPSWRVSDCLSGLSREGSYLGQDVLTWRTAAEEHDLGAGADTVGTGALTWVVSISVDTSQKTATDYASSHGVSITDKTDATTIDGQPAIRVVDTFGRALSYFVANAGRMYVLSLSAASFEPRPPLATDMILDSIARSMTFVTPIARPAPTPVATLSPDIQSLVDAVAGAFAASDADRLRELMPPTCWFSVGYYQSSGSAVSRERYTEGLRAAFSKGLTVSVESRPINAAAPILRGPFWVWSTWSAYGDVKEDSVQLVFDQREGRWYWTGALVHASALRRR